MPSRSTSARSSSSTCGQLGLQPLPLVRERDLPVLLDQREERVAQLAGCVEEQQRELPFAAVQVDLPRDVLADLGAAQKFRVVLACVVPERPQELERDQVARDAPQPRQLGLEVGRVGDRKHEVGRPEHPREPEGIHLPPQRDRKPPRPADPAVLNRVQARIGEDVQAQRSFVRGRQDEVHAVGVVRFEVEPDARREVGFGLL